MAKHIMAVLIFIGFIVAVGYSIVQTRNTRPETGSPEDVLHAALGRGNRQLGVIPLDAAGHKLVLVIARNEPGVSFVAYASQSGLQQESADRRRYASMDIDAARWHTLARIQQDWCAKPKTTPPVRSPQDDTLVGVRCGNMFDVRLFYLPSGQIPPEIQNVMHELQTAVDQQLLTPGPSAP